MNINHTARARARCNEKKSICNFLHGHGGGTWVTLENSFDVGLSVLLASVFLGIFSTDSIVFNVCDVKKCRHPRMSNVFQL